MKTITTVLTAVILSSQSLPIFAVGLESPSAETNKEEQQASLFVTNSNSETPLPTKEAKKASLVESPRSEEALKEKNEDKKLSSEATFDASARPLNGMSGESESVIEANSDKDQVDEKEGTTTKEQVEVPIIPEETTKEEETQTPSEGIEERANIKTNIEERDFVAAPTIPSHDEETVDIPDVYLKTAIAKELGVTSDTIMTKDMLSKISNLKIVNVENLSGLEHATNLEKLDAVSVSAKDLSPISSLTKLTELNMSTDSVNIVSLSSLTNLTKLNLSGSYRLSNLSPISHLVNLEELVLGNTRFNTSSSPIEDISFIKNLKLLESISINRTNLNDISHLQALKKLTSISLENNRIQDISVLSDLSNIETLNLAGNQINDVSSINTLSKLHTVNLTQNYIVDNPLNIEKMIADQNFLSDTANQYQVSVPESIRIALGTSLDVPLSWTHDGLTLTDLSKTHFRQVKPVVTTSESGLQIDSASIQKVSLTGQEAGTYQVTIEPVPGYIKTVSVEVVDLPEPPNLQPLSILNTSITGTTKPGYTVHAMVEGKSYTGTADSQGHFSIPVPSLSQGTKVEVRVADARGVESDPTHITVVDGVAPKLNAVTERLQAVTGYVIDGHKTVRLLVNGVPQRIATVEEDGYFTIPTRFIKVTDTINRPIRNADQITVDYGLRTPEHLQAHMKVGWTITSPIRVNTVESKADYVTGTAEKGTQTLRLVVNGILQRVITPKQAGAGKIEKDGTYRIYSRFVVTKSGDVRRLQKGDVVTIDEGVQINGQYTSNKNATTVQ